MMLGPSDVICMNDTFRYTCRKPFQIDLRSPALYCSSCCTWIGPRGNLSLDESEQTSHGRSIISRNGNPVCDISEEGGASGVAYVDAQPLHWASPSLRSALPATEIVNILPVALLHFISPCFLPLPAGGLKPDNSGRDTPYSHVCSEVPVGSLKQVRLLARLDDSGL